MSNPFPLQAGDRAPDYSNRDTSTEGDRRPSSTGPANPPGDNPAGQFDSPNSTPLFKVGYCSPSALHTPPFDCIDMEGDTSGTGTTIYEPNIREYGDCYDPTAPIRTREVGSSWQVNTDNDANLN